MKDNDKAGLLQAMQNKAQTTKRKKTECREHMNCRKIGLSGCQALGLVST